MIYGKKDPQDVAPVTYCIHCGGEIYPHDTAYIPAEYSGYVCADCVKDWIYETYAGVLGVRCEVNAR